MLQQVNVGLVLEHVETQTRALVLVTFIEGTQFVVNELRDVVFTPESVVLSLLLSVEQSLDMGLHLNVFELGLDELLTILSSYH